MDIIKQKTYQSCGIASTDNLDYRYVVIYKEDKNIDTTLQKNLLRIIEERFEGNQAAFCRMLGFNPTYINAVVRGKKNLGKPNWEKIRKALNLRADEFLQDKSTPVVQNPAEQHVLDWYRAIQSAGMVREAEALMEYLENSAKAKIKEREEPQIFTVNKRLHRKLPVQPKKKRQTKSTKAG